MIAARVDFPLPGGPINRWPWGRGSGNEAFVEPPHQSTNHGHWSKRGADKIEVIAVVPDLSIWIEAESGRSRVDELNSLSLIHI